MYVVKVGNYYIRQFAVDALDVSIILSKELMRTFTKEQAESLAKRVNGEVIKIYKEVTCG